MTHHLTFSMLTSFVNTLATFMKVSTFSNFTFPSSTISWTKWNCTSICFVVAGIVGSFAKQMTLYLSQYIVICPASKLNSKHSVLRQMVFLQAWVAAMYIASVVDKAITTCHLLIQLTTPPNTKNTYPMVDLLLSMSPT